MEKHCLPQTAFDLSAKRMEEITLRLKVPTMVTVEYIQQLKGIIKTLVEKGEEAERMRKHVTQVGDKLTQDLQNYSLEQTMPGAIWSAAREFKESFPHLLSNNFKMIVKLWQHIFSQKKLIESLRTTEEGPARKKTKRTTEEGPARKKTKRMPKMYSPTTTASDDETNKPMTRSNNKQLST